MLLIDILIGKNKEILITISLKTIRKNECALAIISSDYGGYTVFQMTIKA